LAVNLMLGGTVCVYISAVQREFISSPAARGTEWHNVGRSSSRHWQG